VFADPLLHQQLVADLLVLQLDIDLLVSWMAMQDTIKDSWLRRIFPKLCLDVLVILGCLSG